MAPKRDDHPTIAVTFWRMTALVRGGRVWRRIAAGACHVTTLIRRERADRHSSTRPQLVPTGIERSQAQAPASSARADGERRGRDIASSEVRCERRHRPAHRASLCRYPDNGARTDAAVRSRPRAKRRCQKEHVRSPGPFAGRGLSRRGRTTAEDSSGGSAPRPWPAASRRKPPAARPPRTGPKAAHHRDRPRISMASNPGRTANRPSAVESSGRVAVEPWPRGESSRRERATAMRRSGTGVSAPGSADRVPWRRKPRWTDRAGSRKIAFCRSNRRRTSPAWQTPNRLSR